MKNILFYILQWTWGIPQNLFGLFVFLFQKCKGAKSTHYRESVVTDWNLTSGMSLGMFLFLPKVEPERYRRIRVHEFGHSIQSIILGPLFLPVIALPSVLWAGLPRCKARRQKRQISYYSFYPERWANALGARRTGEQPPQK